MTSWEKVINGFQTAGTQRGGAGGTLASQLAYMGEITKITWISKWSKLAENQKLGTDRVAKAWQFLKPWQKAGCRPPANGQPGRMREPPSLQQQPPKSPTQPSQRSPALDTAWTCKTCGTNHNNDNLVKCRMSNCRAQRTPPVRPRSVRINVTGGRRTVTVVPGSESEGEEDLPDLPEEPKSQRATKPETRPTTTWAGHPP